MDEAKSEKSEQKLVVVRITMLCDCYDNPLASGP